MDSFNFNKRFKMSLFKKVISRCQSIYFQGALYVKGKRGLPAQTKEDIELFKNIFENFTDKEIRIFEWGSGMSTIYYAEYLRRKNMKFQWHSIDNNKTWHEIVKGKVNTKGLQSNVQLHLREFLPFWEKPQWNWKSLPPPRDVFSPESENEKEYVNFPRVLDEKFDIIIVDARFRRRCLKTAKDFLTPEGVVILHDAQKKQYHCELDSYRYSKFFKTGAWYPLQETPNKIWVGSMENESILNALKNFSHIKK